MCRHSSCSAAPVTSSASSWASIAIRKRQPAFALSSKLPVDVNTFPAYQQRSCCRYYTREDAENAVRYINGMRLDDRVIRTDWDAGFVDGRQYGRGKHGGQVRCAAISRSRDNLCKLHSTSRFAMNSAKTMMRSVAGGVTTCATATTSSFPIVDSRKRDIATARRCEFAFAFCNRSLAPYPRSVTT